jgi:hypothetical protein
MNLHAFFLFSFGIVLLVMSFATNGNVYPHQINVSEMCCLWGTSAIILATLFNFNIIDVKAILGPNLEQVMNQIHDAERI